MKKIFVALCMVAFLAACDDSSSASAENSEPAALSSAEKQGSSSSSRHCEECNDEAISSDSNAESNGSSRSSSSEQNVASSSSEKLSETSSCSEDDDEYSSSSVILATPCKTETEDNCEYGTLLDDRDGQTYKTVKIGNQWWMAENLNYADSVKTPSLLKRNWCYNNEPDSCSKYGRLYTWAAAMDSVALYDGGNGVDCGYLKKCILPARVQGVCPEGWHLPDTTEWNSLFTAVGGVNNAGKVLKSQTGWRYDGNGTDAYGFSVLPAGFRGNIGYSALSGNFNFDGNNAFFWSDSEGNSNLACSVTLHYDDYGADLSYDNKYLGFSVRCVKD